MDQSTGSLSDGEVLDFGRQNNGNAIITQHGLNHLERQFTPLNFPVLNIEPGSDLLNVFSAESVHIMASNFNYKIIMKEEVLEGQRSSGVLGSGLTSKTLFLFSLPQESNHLIQVDPEKEVGSILDYIRAHRSSSADEFIVKDEEKSFPFGDEMILVAVIYCCMIQEKNVDGTKRSLVDIVSNCVW